MNKNEDEDNKSFGDSDFLSMQDKATRDFRSSGKHANHKIIEKMITLRHNMKYNRHLVSVYMKAKELFDTMVEEHRSQIQSLDEIYRHINHLIRENLSEQRIRSKKNARPSSSSSSSSSILNELYKDKKRIHALLKRMRKSYDKLTNVDTVIGVTIDNINKITFIDDDDKSGKSSDDDSEVEDDIEDEDVEVEDSKDSEHESESEEDSEDSEDSEHESESDDESDESEEDSEDESEEDGEDGEDIDEEAMDDEDDDTEDDTEDDPEIDDEDKDIFIF